MKQKRLNNRAQAHVEVILSFIIFIGALIFIFVFLNPFAETEEKVSVADKTGNIIIEEMSSEIGKLSVIGDSGIGDYNLPSEYGNNFVEVQETAIPLKCNVYFSDDFSGNKNCQFNTYTLGVYTKETMVVWNKVILLKQGYETDYQGLKSNLGISDDFVFSFSSIGGGDITAISVSKTPPIGAEVKSENIPVRLIDNSGIIQELILNVRVW
jgi:hypothetical protein